MTLKGLPIGLQDFNDLIDEHLVYADKTRYIYELLKGPERHFFLSRPRRFGKTLLLSTFEELFSGNRERFKGLWIGGSDYAFEKHPVLRLTLTMSSDSTQKFESKIINTLRKEAAEAGLEIQDDTSSEYFGELIIALYKKFKSKVVVLIDEYDYPVTSNMGNMEVAEANANVLHQFFATLKNHNVSRCIRFTFVTGITRYALTSMDSGANHLTDISLLPKYAGICGFTLEEFDSLFADRMESTLANFNGNINGPHTPENLREEILAWYDSYNWGGKTRILNPYSILKFFAYCNFQEYWLLSGRPSHLTAMINSRPQDFIRPNLESYVSSDQLQKTELTQLQAVPVLFHSGYLTINMITSVPMKDTKSEQIRFKDSFSFRLPNFEISSSYYSDCFNAIFPKVAVDELQAKKENLKQLILSKDAAAVAQFFRDIFTTITYHQKLIR